MISELVKVGKARGKRTGLRTMEDRLEAKLVKRFDGLKAKKKPKKTHLQLTSSNRPKNSRN